MEKYGVYAYCAFIVLLLLQTLASGQTASSVVLAWDAPVLIAGQSITGYAVYRCEVPPGQGTCPCQPQPLPGATTGSSNLSYQDSTVVNGHAYCYSVVTLGTSGGQVSASVLATPSVLVTVGTPPLGAPPTLTLTRGVAARLLTATADSAEPQGAYGAALVLDGQPSTYWHTAWRPPIAPLPHWLRLDLPGSWWLSGLRYLPRQDMSNGTIADYRIEVLGTDGLWQEVAKGTWPAAGLGWREVRWPAGLAQSVRLWSLREISGKAYASAAEIQLVQATAP